MKSSLLVMMVQIAASSHVTRSMLKGKKFNISVQKYVHSNKR